MTAASSTAHMADFIILGFITLTALIGFLNGFTKTALGLAAWSGALWLATLSTPVFSPFVFKYVPHPLAANLIAASATFIITLSIFVYISRTAGAAVKSSQLGGLDRTLGLIFGVMAGAFIFSGLFNFAQAVLSPAKYTELMTQAKTAPYLKKGADFSKGIFLKVAQAWSPGFASGEDSVDKKKEDILKKPKVAQSPQATGYKGTDRQALENLLQEDGVTTTAIKEAMQDAAIKTVKNATSAALSTPQHKETAQKSLPESPALPQEINNGETPSQ